MMMRRILTAFVLSLVPLATTPVVDAGTVEMKVNGLVCGFCAQGIEKTLRRNPATTDVVVSLEHRLVAIAVRDGQDISDAELTKSLKDAGYDVKSIARTERTLDAIRNELTRSR